MKELRLCDGGDLLKTSEYCKREHLGIEVQSFSDPYLPSLEQELVKHKQILAGIPGGKSLHAPFWELNVGTKMKGVRKETFDTLQQAYCIAQELSCTEIVIHNGYIPGTYDPRGWVRRAADFWAEFLSEKDDSVTICLENQFEEDGEILKMVTDENPRLKICLDVGHAHANSHMPVEAWITALKDQIAYFHLHNNHGNQYRKGHNRDEHLGLNYGTIDMCALLRSAENCCPNAIWNIETSGSDFAESLLFLQENGFLKQSAFD